MSPFTLAFVLAASAIAPPRPPTAPVRQVTDVYFGTSIVDPYRWMEMGGSELEAWMKAQNDYTRGVLAGIPGRKDLFDRIQALSDAGTIVTQVTCAGGSYFYEKRAPGDDNFKLWVKAGLAGAERLLIDPETLGSKETHYSIDWFLPSPDGSHVAYGVSPGGSEESVLKVIETASGKSLLESIERARFGVTTWLPDGRSFLYNRLQKLAPGAAPTEKYAKNRVLRHVLGTHPDGEGDEAIFGWGVSKDVPVEADEISYVQYSPASPYLLGYVQKFVKNEVSLYIAPVAAIDSSSAAGAGTIRWRKAVGEEDEVTGADAHGEDLYLLTHKGASRFKIVATRMRSPDFARAKVVVPAGEAVIKGFGVARDALYVNAMEGGLGRLTRVEFATGSAHPVALPFEGAINEFVVLPRETGPLVKLSSWTKPQLWYALDSKTGALTDTKLRPKSPVDFSNVESVEVKARSADGTMVPLSIIYPKGLPRDGSRPALLEGYGAYGITLDPGFNPTLLAWIERGGIYAVAHVRGGGEYGEDWHQAGMKATKPNTIADFIACGEYLVREKYTAAGKLAGEGGSAGGITIGGSLARRPDLFAAMLDLVPVSDDLRIETSPNGPPNVPEFGSVKTEEGFKGLYAMSAYHHVVDGTPYPAVMLTTGVHDPRVDSWQAAKMAARLQAASTSGKPVLLRVDYDAGHGIGSTKSQQNEELADEWAFLLWTLGAPEFQPKSGD